MGKLQGINITSELRSVLDAVLALPQQPNSTSKGCSNGESSSPASGPSTSASASAASSSPRSMSASSPSAILARVREAKLNVTRPSFSTVEEAKSVIELDSGKNDNIKSDNSNSNSASTKTTSVLPLAGVQATIFLINNSQSSKETKSQLLQQFESSLHNHPSSSSSSSSSLSFAPKPPKKSDPHYQKRLELLRLHDEERNYSNLTTNLKTASSLKDDNVTAKSMMYATSVGLNMVVAPISFGVFMYFFAGALFTHFFDSVDEDVPSGNSGRGAGGDIDIRRVIAGVVSGVFMLFVEMILFVIRSHELDASVRKKSRRKENRANPFGYTQKSMARVYTRED